MSIMRVIEKASQFEKTQAVIYQSPFYEINLSGVVQSTNHYGLLQTI